MSEEGRRVTRHSIDHRATLSMSPKSPSLHVKPVLELVTDGELVLGWRTWKSLSGASYVRKSRSNHLAFITVRDVSDVGPNYSDAALESQLSPDLIDSEGSAALFQSTYA